MLEYNSESLHMAPMHEGTSKNYVEIFLSLYWNNILSLINWILILMLVGVYGAFKNFKNKNQIYNISKEKTNLQTPTESPSLSRSHSCSSTLSCSDVSWQPSCSSSCSRYSDLDSESSFWMPPFKREWIWPEFKQMQRLF